MSTFVLDPAQEKAGMTLLRAANLDQAERAASHTEQLSDDEKKMSGTMPLKRLNLGAGQLQ